MGVLVALLGASLAACSSHKSPRAGSTKLTITSPADGAILSGATVPVAARATGNPASVLAWVGDKELGRFSKQGATWTKDAVLTPGANTLTVKALDSSHVVAKELSHVWLLGAPANLGLSVADAGSGDGASVVRIGLGQRVGKLGATVNGHPIKTSLSPTPGNRTVTLGAGDGIVAGANTVSVTAVTDDGASQQASVVLQVAQGAPLAAAGKDVTGGTGVPIQLNAATSVAGAGGGKVSYHWSVLSAPAGAHPFFVKNMNTARPTFVADRRGSYVLRVYVMQPGRPVTADDVTVSEQDSSTNPVGAHLQTQLASVNGVALDGVVPSNAAGTRAALPPGQKGVVFVVWDRQTLEVLAVDVAPPTGASGLLTDLNNATSNRPLGVIAVLSSPAGIDAGLNADSSWQTLLETIGVNKANDKSTWDKNVQAGNPFSFVSVIGESTDPQVWRSNLTPPSSASAVGANAEQLSAGLSGYLQLTNGGVDPYGFVPDTYIPLDTAARSTGTKNTMDIGACAQDAPPHSSCVHLESPAITVCPSPQNTGGFHVAVFWASTLDVVDNASFATNTGCGADGTNGDSAAMAAMAALLAKYPSSDGTNDHLIAIQSIGSPRPQSAALDAQWLQLAGAIGGIGGTPSALGDLGRTSGYSLVGGNSLALPGSDSPYAMTTSSDAPSLHPSARLGAVLARNHRNDLTPSTKSTGAAIGNGFRAAAYAPPTPWPVPCAPGTCPSGSTAAGQQQALRYITDVTAPDYSWDTTFRIGPSHDGHCWQPQDPSIRDAYCDTNISAGEWTNFGGFLCSAQADGVCEPVAPPPSHPGYSFVTADWNAVARQLSKEASYVASVERGLAKLKTAAEFVANGGDTNYDLNTLETNILNEVNLSHAQNTKNSSTSFWLDIDSDIAGVAWAIAGAFEPGLSALFGVVSEGLAAAGDATSTSGSSGGGAGLSGKVETTAQDVVVDMTHRYANVPNQIAWLGDMVVTDWGKLAAVANGPLTSDQWTNVEDAMATSAVAWMEPIVLSAAYQPTPLRRYTDLNCNSTQTCNQAEKQQAIYSGDANTFSCEAGAFNSSYFPWNVPDGAQYLAVGTSGPPARYVLSNVPPVSGGYRTPGNPSDFYIPGDQRHPPAAPSNVTTPLFAKTLEFGDTTNLGLFKPDFYEHTLTLTTGNVATCRNAEVLYGPGMAALGNGQGASNVFYLTQGSPRRVSNIYSSQSRWNGPGGLPGSPDGSSGLAAVTGHVFFHQGKQLMNDYYSAADGWQGPGPLPGSPDANGVAAALPGPSNPHAFFVDDGRLVNDYYSPSGGWQGPGVLPGRVDKETPLAAVSGQRGQMNVFFLQDGALMNDWYWPPAPWQGSAPLPGRPDNGSQLAAAADTSGTIRLFFVQGGALVSDLYTSAGGWQGPTPAVAHPDPGSGITAFALGAGEFSVVASVNRALVIDHYSSSTGWSETPVLYPR